MEHIAKAIANIIMIALIPIVVGAGVLAYTVGITWTPANTNTLLGALIAFCGVGTILLIGIPVIVVGAILWMAHARQIRKEENEREQFMQGQIAAIPPNLRVIDQAPAGYLPLPNVEQTTESAGEWTPAGAIADEWTDA